MEILCNGIVKHHNQALGIIVAESEKLANRAACLVKVKYRRVRKPIVTIEDAKKDSSRILQYFAYPANDRGKNIDKIIKGENYINGQYHFTMEPQTCITRPAEDGLDIITSTQWIDGSQIAISEALNIDEKRLCILLFQCTIYLVNIIIFEIFNYLFKKKYLEL